MKTLNEVVDLVDMTRRVISEMDVLPSDLCGKHNKLEDIPTVV